MLEIEWGNCDRFEGDYYIVSCGRYCVCNFRNGCREGMKG